MNQKFDLLGDPIPDGRGKPGRAGHVATAENTRRVRALLVAGMKPGDIARQIGVSTPTLRKHYFSNGKINVKLARQMALAEMRGRNVLRLDAQADKGNVSAMRTLETLIDKAERELIEAELGRTGGTKEKAPGVKQQRELQGYEADDDLEQELARESDAYLN